MSERVSSLLQYTSGLFKLYTRDEEGNATNADATPKISITKLCADGTELAIVVEADMSNVTTGEYRYDWDTEAVSAGTYRVETWHAVDSLKRKCELEISVYEHTPED